MKNLERRVLHIALLYLHPSKSPQDTGPSYWIGGIMGGKCLLCLLGLMLWMLGFGLMGGGGLNFGVLLPDFLICFYFWD